MFRIWWAGLRSLKGCFLYMTWKIQYKIELSVFNKLYIGNSSQIINNSITRLKQKLLTL